MSPASYLTAPPRVAIRDDTTVRCAAWLVAVVLLAMPAGAMAADPLTTRASIAKAKQWAADRRGDVSFAVVPERGRVRGLRRARVYPSASVIKAMLMVAVLRSARDRELTRAERRQVGPMIVRSSNRTARALFSFHGPAAVQRVARRAGMRRFSIGPFLFEAQITAEDQARFFARIDRLVPRRHRAYARRLLRGIVPRQRWGIPPAAERHGLTASFKGGWRRGIVHQVSLLERRDGRRIALAVLTANGPGKAYGERTIEGIAERVLRGGR